MKKIGLSIAAILVAGVAYLSQFFFLMPLGPNEDHFYDRMRSLYNSTLYRYSNDPSFQNKLIKSDIPVDIVIPIVEKDLPTGEKVVDSVRAFLMHPIGKIYFVAPESEKIRQLAQRKGCLFIEENSVMPHFRNGFKKNNWIKQQYLKLNAGSFVEQEHFLVMDADTVLIRPHVFLHKGKTIFNIMRDYSLARKQFVKEATGVEKFYNLGFTAHHMLFEKRKLKALQETLEKKHGKPWMDALNELETSDDWFSEYELYANFCAYKFTDQLKFVHARNESLGRERLPYITIFSPVFANHSKTISMHQHF